MKLSQISAGIAASNVVETMVINQRSGEPYLSKAGKPVTLDYVGSESETFRLHREEAIRIGLVEQIDESDVDRLSIRNKVFIAACAVVGWSGVEGDDENDLPCTRQNVLELLRADHVFQQLWAKIWARRDFFTGSSPA